MAKASPPVNSPSVVEVDSDTDSIELSRTVSAPAAVIDVGLTDSQSSGSRSSSTSTKRSAVWAYFSTDPDPAMRDWVSCDLCKPLVKKVKTSDRGTSNLHAHLKVHHPRESAMCGSGTAVASRQVTLTPSRKTTTTARNLSLFQPKITDAIERTTKYGIDSVKYKTLTNKLTTLLAKQMLPFSLVEEQEFIDFVQELDPRYKPPGRKVFSQKTIPVKYNDMKQHIIKELEKVGYISCTTDAWSSCTTEPYLSLTVHFVTPTWEMKTYCLRTIYMPESHTGDNVATMLRAILRDEYNVYLNRVTSFTTDSASNMIKACSELPVTRTPCFGHILHNAINNAMKNETLVVNAVKLCRQIVSTLSHSFRLRSELAKKQKECGLKVQNLVGEVSTRWGLKYEMVTRIFANIQPIQQILLADRKYAKLSPSWEQVCVMEMFVVTMEPFSTLTDRLSMSKTVSISSLYPLLNHIKKVCETQIELSDSSPEMIQTSSNIRKAIWKYINDRYEGDAVNGDKLIRLLKISSFLDPRLGLKDDAATKADVIIQAIALECEESSDSDSMITVTPSAKQPTPNTSKASLMDLLMDVNADEEDIHVDAETRTTNEIDYYIQISKKMICREEDLLHWWGRKGDQFPMLRRLARKYLCINATSTASERLFSLAGNIVNKKRNSLKPEKPINTWVHWHALPVLSLSYTYEGTCLLSGGHESVLVKWSHGSYGDQKQREYLPRLGAPLSHITASEDNSVYVTSHMDNSIKVIRNWIVTQVFQGLTRDFMSKQTSQFPAGVNFDPRSAALVINGLPGHLQFYSIQTNKLLFNLDVVGQNYVSGDNLSKQHNHTAVELVEFSSNGEWMVTVERWAGAYSEQCRMKFWFYEEELKMYVLNTDVDTPHTGCISSACFAPSTDGHSTMFVSVGAEDKKFKIWVLSEDSGTSQSGGEYWRVESTGYYKNKRCHSAHFSDDGSVLAVAFENSVTLWDPFENDLCTTLDQTTGIQSLRFCYGSLSNCLVVCTEKSVSLWDLMSYSEKFNWDISGCSCLCVDEKTSSIVAFSNTTGYILDASTGKLECITLPASTRSVTSCNFIPESPIHDKTEEEDSPKSAAVRAVRGRLYFCTNTGSILTLEDESCLESSKTTPNVEQASMSEIAKNYSHKRGTPLSTLLSSQLITNTMSNNTINRRRGLATNQLVKEIGETSCVAMPSLNTLCNAFLRSSLLDKPARGPSAGRNYDESDESEEEDNFSDSDMEIEETTTTADSVDSNKSTNSVEEGIRLKEGYQGKLKKSDIMNFYDSLSVL